MTTVYFLYYRADHINAEWKVSFPMTEAEVMQAKVTVERMGYVCEIRAVNYPINQQ